MAGLRQFQAFCVRNGFNEALDAIKIFDATTPPQRPRRKSSAPTMTPELRKRILTMHYTEKQAQHEIAASLGLNQGQVNHVINGTF